MVYNIGQVYNKYDSQILSLHYLSVNSKLNCRGLHNIITYCIDSCKRNRLINASDLGNSKQIIVLVRLILRSSGRVHKRAHLRQRGIFSGVPF